MKEPIRLEDFLNFALLSNVSYAPDGKHAVFTVSHACKEKNEYEQFLHCFDGDTIFQLTSHGNVSMMLWKNADVILFASGRDKEDQDALANGEERTCFYEMNIHGGEAQKAFTLPLNVTSIKMLSTTQYALTAHYDLRFSYEGENEEERKARITAKKEEADYEILDEVPFYYNGRGFINQVRNSLFLYDTITKKITRISELKMEVQTYEIDTKAHCIYYAGEVYETTICDKHCILSYDYQNGTQEELLPQDADCISHLLMWQDQLLVIASNQARYGSNENAQFYMLDPKTKERNLFCAYEDALGSSVGSDCRYGGGRVIKQYNDRIYFITTLYNHSALYVLDRSGTITPVIDVEGSIDDFDITDDTILTIGMHNRLLQELYQYEFSNHSYMQLSKFHDIIHQTKDIRPCIPCNFMQDEMKLYGWVILPRDYDPTKSYPAILDIHGGPKTVYGSVYYHEMQVWANIGYFVFFMNPRGGDGRGNAFADLRGKYGTIDYDDLIKFTDVVLSRYPAIDSNRLGVTGGSYGGFMTNWIITHTNRFQAAASQRSIANWISFRNTSDIGPMFCEDQQAATIEENMEKLWWHSPLAYVKHCQTPTLFIHSDEDYRCPLSEGLQMYMALATKGVETRMCLFHGENHELSRSGKPKHRIKRLQEITNWMEQHLK